MSINKVKPSDYRELASLSVGYAREEGTFLRVTNPFAAPSTTFETIFP